MRKLILKTGLVLVATVFALLVGEVFLRFSGVQVGRNSDTMFTVMDTDSVIGWRMKPGLQEKVSFVDVENIPVRSNSLGFWDNEFPEIKDPKKTRIVFLGDSFTWGMGVSENERFSNVLQARNNGLEALNFGMPGYGTDQELLVWQNLAQRYKPDIVVLTLYQNDYADNTFVIRSGRRKPYFDWKPGAQPNLVPLDQSASDFWRDAIYSEAAPPYKQFYPRPIEYRSRLMHVLVKYSDVARLIYNVAGRTKLAPQVANAEPANRPKALSLSDLPATQQNEVGLMSALLKEFNEKVEKTGARFVVVLAGTPNINFDVQRPNLKEQGIEFVDATTDVLASHLSGSPVYFPYNKHWTASSHQVVASLLEQQLKNTAK